MLPSNSLSSGLASSEARLNLDEAATNNIRRVHDVVACRDNHRNHTPFTAARKLLAALDDRGMETLRAGLVCVPGGATTGIDAKDTWLRAAAIVITRNRETEITPGAKTDSILVESGLELQQILYQLGILWDEAETMFKSQHRSRSDEVNKYLNFPNIVKTKHKVLFLFPISYPISHLCTYATLPKYELDEIWAHTHNTRTRTHTRTRTRTRTRTNPC